MQKYTFDEVVMRYYHFMNEYVAMLSQRSREKKLGDANHSCRYVARKLS